ncbi:helix-turn-helix domain-containing protein [Candidatus Leptofilum sp.]|uniref:helix-turn-helix domain-containing protein n=1 Tax=Candidatus Leptofilum sp. TaxID=3241576 RepID=UPI003B5A6FC1
MEQFQPKDILIIEELEMLKVISDPLRTQILEILIFQPATVKQLADKLGLAPSKLYYHVNMLEKAGFITVVETRMVANMQEKYYRAVANSFQLDESLLTFHTDTGRDTINTMLNSIMDATKDDILRSLQARLFALDQGAPEQPRRFMLTRHNAVISESRANEFMARLDELLKEFSSEKETAKTAESQQNYAFTVAFYPSIYYPDENHES